MPICLCAECKHWNKEAIQAEHAWAELADWPDQDDYGECERTRNKFEQRHGPPVGKELAFAEDGEDYRAVLVTRKDFGCIQGVR